jgi:hypothetical protein
VGVRLLEGGVALGFGAGDALVASKVTGMGPGGIPWTVYYEAVGIAAGLFGDKVGLSSEIRDPLLFSALSLAGVRATRAALAGKLMSGPKAWGGHGEGGDVFGTWAGDPGSGGMAYPAIAGPRVRAMPGRGGGFSVWPVTQEAPGVAG